MNWVSIFWDLSFLKKENKKFTSFFSLFLGLVFFGGSKFKDFLGTFLFSLLVLGLVIFFHSSFRSGSLFRVLVRHSALLLLVPSAQTDGDRPRERKRNKQRHVPGSRVCLLRVWRMGASPFLRPPLLQVEELHQKQRDWQRDKGPTLPTRVFSTPVRNLGHHPSQMLRLRQLCAH